MPEKPKGRPWSKGVPGNRSGKASRLTKMGEEFMREMFKPVDAQIGKQRDLYEAAAHTHFTLGLWDKLGSDRFGPCRGSGDALGPRAALAARFFLGLIR